MDVDVAQWLREHAPKPLHEQNYDQGLSAQYGLKPLIEHVWKVIGVASRREIMDELRNKMEELYGREPGFEYELKLIGAKP